MRPSRVLLLLMLLSFIAREAHGAPRAADFIAGKLRQAEIADLSDLPVPDRALTAAEILRLIKMSTNDLLVLNARIVDGVHLPQLRVGQKVSFVNCAFESDFSAPHADFNGGLQLASSVVKGDLNLRRATLKFLDLTQAHVVGVTDLNNAIVNTDLTAAGVTLDKPVQAEYIHVGGSANFGRAGVGTKAPPSVLHGLDLYAARIDFDLNLDSSRIAGNINAHSATVRDLWAAGTTFEGDAVFVAVAARSFYSTKLTAKGRLDFSRAKIDGLFRLRSAQVEGPFNIEQGQVSIMEVTDGSRFSAREPATFAGLIADTVIVKNARFGAGLQGQRIRAKGNVEISTSSFDSGAVVLRGLRVEGATILDGNKISKSAHLDLTDCKLFTLSLGGLSAPARTFSLTGTIYDRLDNTDFKEVMGLINSADFSADTYTAFETYLKKAGYTEEANDVFVAMKRRLRHERLRPLGPAWLWSVLLDGLIGYGRHPSRVLWWALPFVLLGGWVFRRRADVVLINDRENPAERVYRPILFSVDVFAPVIDLQAAKTWRIRDERPRQFAYFLFLRALGWLLVPLAAGAVTGIIK